MNNKDKVYKNTKVLARLYGEKISDIEKEIGLSTGYLSRKAKSLSIDSVYALAKHFDIPIGEFVETDYSEIFGKKLAAMDFCESVKEAQKTLSGSEILWYVNQIIEDHPEASPEEE